MSVPGLNVSGRRRKRPAGRLAESVETLRVGSGGKWRPHQQGFWCCQALESKETLRKVAVPISVLAPGQDSERTAAGLTDEYPEEAVKPRRGVESSITDSSHWWKQKP
jgi:hypothetical protein